MENSNQDNINSFLDGMDFDSTPAEQAPSPQSVPFTPAAVWPGEEPAQQTAAAAPVQAEPVPAAPPTAQPAAPQEAIPTPAPTVQTPQTPQAVPTVQQQVITQAQPIVQQVVPQQQPVVQQPVMQQAAPDPAPVQETMLDKFDMVMQNLEVQGEKRMLEALAAKPAIFSYAKVKENIEDRDSTFEDLRQRYEADFPELSDPKTISWTVNYGKTTKSVSNPGSDKVYDIKAEIENSKAFKEALKKAKTDADKNPECIVKLFKKAQTKGEALSGIKELCLTKAEAAQTNKPIVLLPSKDGRVYEQRRNEIGCFTAPAENVREFEDIRAEFKMALPKIPAHIFSKVMGFFKSISDELHYEVLVHILYDKNALFHSFSNESNKFSAALEYPYDRADITYMKTVYRNFPLPRLVFGFKVNTDGYIQQVCLGVAKNCRILREDTPMYHYPFSNVLKNFYLCTGGNLLPEIKKIHALSYMPDYILGLPNNDDYFQHKNNKLHLSHRELMEHLADKSPEYYYSDILIPSGKTLADFYEAVSL